MDGITKIFSITRIIALLFVLYISYVGYGIYGIFTPPLAGPNDPHGSLGNALNIGEPIELYVYSSHSSAICSLQMKNCDLVYHEKGLEYNYQANLDRFISLKITPKMIQTNAVYLHSYLTHADAPPMKGMPLYDSNKVSYTRERISTMLPLLSRPRRLIDLSEIYDESRALEKDLNDDDLNSSAKQDESENASLTRPSRTPFSFVKKDTPEQNTPPLRKSLIWLFSCVCFAYLFVNVELSYDKTARHPENRGKLSSSNFFGWRVLRGISFLVLLISVGMAIVKYQANRTEYARALQVEKELSVSIARDATSVMHIPVTTTLRVAVTDAHFPRTEIQPDLFYFMSKYNTFGLTANNKQYKPMFFFNNHWNPGYSYRPVFETSVVNGKQLAGNPLDHLTFKLHLQFHSLGLFRLLAQFTTQYDVVRENFGFSERDLDAFKDLFYRNSVYTLASTMVIVWFHMLFNFLAFKNEITYWRKRKTTQGISVRAIMFGGISQAIILFYLIESEASKLILLPKVIEVLINHWKMKKALKIELIAAQYLPIGLSCEALTKEEQETEEADVAATKYMMWVVYPLVFGYAIFSVLYLEHPGWFSWLLTTLSGYVYAFGFVMMTPQLFINYKMKSVAHLPWDAMVYKAFTTFVDDIFAFIIYMPMLHRIACLRDDVVFFCFLYQKWIYPTDYSRVNEFGFSGEDVVEVELERANASKEEIAHEKQD